MRTINTVLMIPNVSNTVVMVSCNAVNIGERIDVVPIVDGYIIQKGVYRLPFGGRQITEHLRRLLTEGGYR